MKAVNTHLLFAAGSILALSAVALGQSSGGAASGPAFHAGSFRLTPQDKPAGDGKAKNGEKKPAAKADDKSAAKDEKAKPAAPPKPKEEKAKAEKGGSSYHAGPYGYKEVSSFFNIREANANLERGEWEYETTFEWSTRSGEGDEFELEPSLKYGITDDMYVELEIPLLLGEGGDQGNGELGLVLFNQFVHETESVPAFAMWVSTRIPSGEGSKGVDAALHFNLTKTLAPKFRGHLEGFIETANGHRGGEEGERRGFQWGVGPGFDYQIDDKTIVVLNYLNRVNDEEEYPNQNILEFGVAREITHGQHVKVAADVGLDGHESTPNFGVKIQWSIEW